MSAKEIIMAMVDGLRNPAYGIDMMTFGSYQTYNTRTGNFLSRPKCFGCAATNTITQISGVKFRKNTIEEVELRAEALRTEDEFLQIFEFAIDKLRCGLIEKYNEHAGDIRIAEIKRGSMRLPYLESDFTDKYLDAYVNLANAQ